MYSGCDTLFLQLLLVYILALPSLLHPSILFSCFLYLYIINIQVHYKRIKSYNLAVYGKPGICMGSMCYLRNTHFQYFCTSGKNVNVQFLSYSCQFTTEASRKLHILLYMEPVAMGANNNSHTWAIYI